MLCPWHCSDSGPWKAQCHPALPPPCFPVLPFSRRTHPGLSGGFLEGRERGERTRSWPPLLALPVGFHSGLRSRGGGQSGCRMSPHTRARQKLGRPPTSELSMLLMSAQCPVCAPAPSFKDRRPPHAPRKVVQAVFTACSPPASPPLLT